MTIQIGILLALLCAFATNLGFLLKHRGACAAPDVSMRHPLGSAVGLFRSKWFAIGMLVALGAWSSTWARSRSRRCRSSKLSSRADWSS
jgi:hypothetical protein